MSIRAVLFDFDGTLADSFAAIIASVNHVRGTFELPPLPDAAVRRLIGHGLPALMADVCPGVDPAEAVARYRAHHAGTMISGTKLMPGVRDTVAELHRRGLGLGVCSNKAVAFTRQLVAALGLGDHMTAVLGPEDVGGKPKPDPAMLLEGCTRLSVSANSAVYVGDMSVDVAAGKAAGIPVWLVHVGLAGSDDPRTLGPARVLGDFAEILKWV
jgi:2-phosphoglycolate phosphatase